MPFLRKAGVIGSREGRLANCMETLCAEFRFEVRQSFGRSLTKFRSEMCRPDWKFQPRNPEVVGLAMSPGQWPSPPEGDTACRGKVELVRPVKPIGIRGTLEGKPECGGVRRRLTMWTQPIMWAALGDPSLYWGRRGDGYP